MSLSLGTVACGALRPGGNGLAHVTARQARMHPQSTGGPVLRSHSCVALSPGPQRQSTRTSAACHPGAWHRPQT